ncbi:MAG: DEAD/DEAH box helicase [Opitutaceae bacterium]|jgi:superfamily II DNA/RNA helicase|nr:DEAD/DEAH box helicase [Opitutaceae bacterium]
MLKKLFKKLRGSLSAKPASAKAAKPASKPAPQPSRKPAAGRRGASERPSHGDRAGGGLSRRDARGHDARQRRGGRRDGGGRPPARGAGFELPARASVKPAAPVEIPPQDTPFSRLGLSDPLAFAVSEMGYTAPTPIQEKAIPVVLSGRDVTGSAQTGTGKTAAFALPILQRLGAHGRLRCLILEPTRELAIQVEEAFQNFARHTDLAATVVYGGVGYGRQREELARGVDVLAATPGRLLDHIEQGTVSLSGIEILVLDEVDHMLDIGFLPDVRRIVGLCPKNRQTLFFTATLPPELVQLSSWALRDPVDIRIAANRAPAETVSHAFYPVVDRQKFDLLLEVLRRTDFKSVIIFTRTKMGADRIARRLLKENHSVGVIHSDRNQRERVEALEGFRSGRFEILVATDIAARGLDIAGVSHVINYNVPENPEDYVHRIGRTGRARMTGDAFTLVAEDEARDARSIERFIGAEVERKKLDGFPYIYSAVFDEAQQTAAAPKPVNRLVRGSR